jgi:hypothetical protein
MTTYLTAAEVTAADPQSWVRSGRSGAAGHCVELAKLGDSIAVRNSNDPLAGALTFNRMAMAAFVGGAAAGDFDHLINA